MSVPKPMSKYVFMIIYIMITIFTTRVGHRVGCTGVCVGGLRDCIRCARLFGYQHIGISNANRSG